MGFCKIINNTGQDGGQAECIYGYNIGGTTNVYLIDYDLFIKYYFNLQAFGNVVDYIVYDGEEVDMPVIKDTQTLDISLSNKIYSYDLKFQVDQHNEFNLDMFDKAKLNRYVVVIKSSNNNYYVFGGTNGAKLTYSMSSGDEGGAWTITANITHESLDPLYMMYHYADNMYNWDIELDEGIPQMYDWDIELENNY